MPSRFHSRAQISRSATCWAQMHSKSGRRRVEICFWVHMQNIIGENTTSSPSRANRFRKIPRCFAKLDEEDATGELSGSQQDRALHLTCHSSFQQRISE